MLLFLRISILIATYLYFFRDSFVAELAISFVPYIIWFCILALIIEIYLIIHESKRRRKYKWIKIFFTILITILTIWIWKQKIIEENPDIVIMVEFSDEHENEMKEFFKENYPYMNRNSRSMTLAWDVVFSKIPLENITETHLVEAWARDYSNMKVLCDECGEWVDLYVIHTAAPVSVKNYDMRNNQIGKLLSEFIKHNKSWTPTIIIWDFNLSPWSHYYKQLNKHRNMLNALSYQSPSYTRSLLQQWIFRSHIDQLFISPEIKISEVKIEDLLWSDHRSFTFQFWTD